MTCGDRHVGVAVEHHDPDLIAGLLPPTGGAQAIIETGRVAGKLTIADDLAGEADVAA